MTAKLIALVFILSSAASTCLAAEAPGRYTMSIVGDSVWRLDSATGAMSVCGQRLDHWACESVADDTLALKEEVARIARENQELRDKLAKAGEKEAEAAPGKGAEGRRPDAKFPDQALDEMTDFVNAIIRRLQEMVRRLSAPEKRQI